MQVLFFFCILYFWNTQQKRGEISVRQFQYRYKQIRMRSVELIWPCSILAKKNIGHVLARGLSIELTCCVK